MLNKVELKTANEIMTTAINDIENHNANGGINWDFVDADLHINMGKKFDHISSEDLKIFFDNFVLNYIEDYFNDNTNEDEYPDDFTNNISF